MNQTSIQGDTTSPPFPAQQRICIIGMGYVGLPLALAFQRHGEVVGFDINQQRIDELRQGVDVTLEATTAELQAADQLSYSADAADIAACNVFIVTVPTPIDLSQQPDLGAIKSATELIAGCLKRGDLVIYESTVYPGVTEEMCLPLLERSGLRAGVDFGLGYSPERINPADKERKLADIRKITAGLTPACASQIDALYAKIITAGTFPAASIRTAEMAKVVENAQRDINIALMNELAIICDHMDLRTYEVLEAAGTKWNFLPFKPGLVGGHCIGVDPYYLIHKSQRVGHHPDLIISGRRINNSMGTYIARKVTRMMTQRDIEVTRANVLILGISFKENCPDLRNSKVVDIHRYLLSMVASIDVYDPLVRSEDAKAELGIELCAEPISGHYDCVILAVPHDSFLQRGADWVRALCRQPCLVYDIKSALVPDLVDKTL
ncbi:MAG: nucleotide sugar dehydrogenase [Gammaproteobacteria bacterium]|nr:nucleotide sugar dehydrogenase [Gammaproteobacteria bacterium]